MLALSTTKKRKFSTERVEDKAPLKNNATLPPPPTCSIDGCKNNAAGGGICIKHGGKQMKIRKIPKTCSVEGCDKQAQRRGVCCSHGAMVIKKRCSAEGCYKVAKAQGFCISHGAVVNKRCRVEGCWFNARNQGVCVLHGAIVKRCSVDGCNNRREKEGLCKRHHKAMALHSSADECTKQKHAGDSMTKSKRFRTEDCKKGAIQGGVCTSRTTYLIDGCKNNAARGGICIKHGGKRMQKKCSVEGCDKQAQSSQGVCISHGAVVNYKRCSVEGCENHVKAQGVCLSHGAVVKLCSVDGCNKHRQRGGLCKRHHKAMALHSSAVGFSKQTHMGDAVTKRYISEYCSEGAMVQGGVSIHHPAYVYKPHSCTKQAKATALDSDDEEEELLGELIYRFSRTAQLRAAQAQLQK